MCFHRQNSSFGSVSIRIIYSTVKYPNSQKLRDGYIGPLSLGNESVSECLDQSTLFPILPEDQSNIPVNIPHRHCSIRLCFWINLKLLHFKNISQSWISQIYTGTPIHLYYYCSSSIQASDLSQIHYRVESFRCILKVKEDY